MKKLFTLFAISSVLFASAQKTPYLLVGTYTDGKSKGIYVYRFLPGGKTVLVDSALTPNPSYLAVSPDQRFIYAVNELGEAEGGGRVTAFQFNKGTGALRQINSASAAGEHPCYITVDKTQRWAIVGNYTGGNAAVLPIRKDGSLGEAVSTVQHFGRSVTDRQEKPHVHATVLSPDNRTLYVPDLGKDKLMVYSFNHANGSLLPKDTLLTTAKGAGPRHFDFHPSGKWAYLVQELTGTVTAFRNTGGKLQAVQTISALPENFTGSMTAADIHVSPDGKFLYTSLRDEANALAVFNVNPASGKLTLLGHHATLGKTPRNFSIDPTGNYLLVANQRSDEVVVFSVNRKTGRLTDTGNRISVGNPVCLKWIGR